LDDTRKLKQAAEQESAGCLRLERGAPLPADQEWYGVRFQRAKRGVRDKTTERHTNDELTPEQQDDSDARKTELVRIPREAVRVALEHKGNVATPDVPLPSKVVTHSGGIVNVSWVQPGASVKCAWRKAEGSKVKWLAATIDSLNADGTVNVQFNSSRMFCEGVGRGDLRQATEAEGGINLMNEFDYNTTEAAAAAEVVTSGNVTSTHDGSVEASNLEDSPVIVPDEPDPPNQQRECITQGEIAAHLRW
jgi:hypothetical protein